MGYIYYSHRFSPYRAVHALRLGYKNQSVNVILGNIAVCSQIHTKHTNTFCGQNVEFLNVKLDGTYSDHWALKGLIYRVYTVYI